MWIKTRYFLKEKKHITKGEKYLSKSSHEGEVAKKGENQRGNHGFRGRPSRHWMVVNIQASVSGFQLISIGIKLLILSILCKLCLL